MSVIVEQTIPWSPEALDLTNPKRWTTLFPLIRPSVVPVTTSKGQTILLNRALSNSPHIQIAAIGRSGNFSSKFLSDSHIAAIITETSGAGLLTAQDIRHTLEQNGIKIGQGLIVLRAGKERQVSGPENDVVEVETEGELEFDHLLSLLELATETARSVASYNLETENHRLRCAQDVYPPDDRTPEIVHENRSHNKIGVPSSKEGRKCFHCPRGWTRGI